MNKVWKILNWKKELHSFRIQSEKNWKNWILCSFILSLAVDSLSVYHSLSERLNARKGRKGNSTSGWMLQFNTLWKPLIACFHRLPHVPPCLFYCYFSYCTCFLDSRWRYTCPEEDWVIKNNDHSMLLILHRHESIFGIKAISALRVPCHITMRASIEYDFIDKVSLFTGHR